MPVSPMIIHFYGPENEEVKVATRKFIPYGLMKEAVKLEGALHDKDKKDEPYTEAEINSISQFIVKFFGSTFTIEELENMADLEEVLAVFNSILNYAHGISASNPTPPQN